MPEGTKLQQATPWYLTWNIIYEFLRVITHPRVLPSPWNTPDAFTFVEAVMAAQPASLLVATTRHEAIAAEVVAELPDVAGNTIHDLHTAVLMREHGIGEIVTRDTDLHRFPFLEVTDPLR